MNILSIKGNEEFKLNTITYAADSKGKERMVCNYELYRGPKNSLRIVFEGYAKSDILRVREKYTFKSLMSMFEDRRIYLQGSMFLDGQFEKPVDKQEK